MKKIASIFVLVSFFITGQIGICPVYAQDLVLPNPGAMIHLSPDFTPSIIRGMSIDVKNPFAFRFLIDQGDNPPLQEKKKDLYKRLVKYFLAAMTIPEDKQWVNLSPYEKDRIIDSDFGKTEMGRDLLAQDYMLKQITATLLYPQESIGKEFWKKVYKEAYQKYGTTQVPINTFNKVWIIPDTASVYERNNTVLIVDSKLKVMLEEDYLSLEKHTGITKTHDLASQIVRTIVLPALDREVNTGKNFANLRQIYNGMVLATWYKQALKKSILTQIYANKDKVKGVDLSDPFKSQQQVYQQYLKAFKLGVFNLIKEEQDASSGQIIPRKYFSGGFQRSMEFDPISHSMRIPIRQATVSQAMQVLGNNQSRFDSAEVVISATNPVMSTLEDHVWFNMRDLNSVVLSGDYLRFFKRNKIRLRDLKSSDDAKRFIDSKRSNDIKRFELEFFSDFIDTVRKFISNNPGVTIYLHKKNDFFGALEKMNFFVSDEYYSLVNKYVKQDLQDQIYLPFTEKDLTAYLDQYGDLFSQSEIKGIFQVCEDQGKEIANHKFQGIRGVLMDYYEGVSRRDWSKDPFENKKVSLVMNFLRSRVKLVNAFAVEVTTRAEMQTQMQKDSLKFKVKNENSAKACTWIEYGVIRPMINDRFLNGKIIVPQIAFSRYQQIGQWGFSGFGSLVEHTLIGMVIPLSILGISHLGHIDLRVLESLNPHIYHTDETFNTWHVLFLTFGLAPAGPWAVNRIYRERIDKEYKKFFNGLLINYILDLDEKKQADHQRDYEEAFKKVKVYFKEKGAKTADLKAISALQGVITGALGDNESYWMVGKNLSDAIDLAENKVVDLPVSLDTVFFLALKRLHDDDPDSFRELEVKCEKKPDDEIFKRTVKFILAIQGRNDAYVEGRVRAATYDEIDGGLFEPEYIASIDAQNKPSHADIFENLFLEINHLRDLTPTQRQTIMVAQFFLRSYSRLEQIHSSYPGRKVSKEYIERWSSNVDVIIKCLRQVKDQESKGEEYFLNDRQIRQMIMGLQEAIKKVAGDKAQVAGAPLRIVRDNDVGGINLNSTNLNLRIKRDGNGVPLPVFDQDPAVLNAPGFVPVIISIHPMGDVRILLGLKEHSGL